MNFLQALQSNPFLLFAVLAGIASSVASGITGTYIVVKRIVFISGSIAHSVLGGMGLFLWMRRQFSITWITPLQGAILAALASAWIMSWTRARYKEREDTVIAALWSSGMAIGVIFVSLTPGYNVELMNFLFGNILWTDQTDLITLLALDIVVAILTFINYKKFQAICFDEDQARLQGISIHKTYALLLSMIALSIVMLIQVVGSILVIAILSIPAAIACNMSRKLSTIILIAIALGCCFTSIGTFISYQLNWPPGATISLCSAIVYTAALLIKERKDRIHL